MTQHTLLNGRHKLPTKSAARPLNDTMKRQSNDTYNSSLMNSRRTSKFALNLDENWPNKCWFEWRERRTNIKINPQIVCFFLSEWMNMNNNKEEEEDEHSTAKLKPNNGWELFCLQQISITKDETWRKTHTITVTQDMFEWKETSHVDETNRFDFEVVGLFSIEISCWFSLWRLIIRICSCFWTRERMEKRCTGWPWQWRESSRSEVVNRTVNQTDFRFLPSDLRCGRKIVDRIREWSWCKHPRFPMNKFSRRNGKD